MAQQTTRAATKPATIQETPPAPTENLPAPRPRTTVNAIVPQTWQEVASIASAICRANMAPKSYCKVDGYGKPVFVDGKPVPEPDKVAIAIMHGMEVGMTPMASLQSLAVINGMPSLYGDGMLAVVRASGLLEDFVEDMEWDAKGPVKATCRVKRRGEPTWGTMDCARDDAIKAQWWGKAGPWTLTPHRMLQMRARGWALRDKFADVLRGLRSAEELEDMVDVTPRGFAAVSAAEPQRSDFQQPDSAQPATPVASADSGQPGTSPPGGGGDDHAAPATPAQSNVTDVDVETGEVIERRASKADLDDSDSVVALTFSTYEKVGDFFVFAEEWVPAPERTEKELIAFGAFYKNYILERLNPEWKSPKVHEAMKEIHAMYQDALQRASKR